VPKVPEVARVEVPEVPKVPEVARVEVPEVPKVPEVARVEVPEVPKVPEVARVEVPEVPKVDFKTKAEDALREGLGRERPVTPEQAEAVRQAHDVAPERSVGEYTLKDLLEKARILRNAEFNPEETRILFEKGICGKEKVDATKETPPAKVDIRAEAEKALGEGRKPLTKEETAAVQKASRIPSKYILEKIEILRGEGFNPTEIKILLEKVVCGTEKVDPAKAAPLTGLDSIKIELLLRWFNLKDALLDSVGLKRYDKLQLRVDFDSVEKVAEEIANKIAQEIEAKERAKGSKLTDAEVAEVQKTTNADQILIKNKIDPKSVFAEIAIARARQRIDLPREGKVFDRTNDGQLKAVILALKGKTGMAIGVECGGGKRWAVITIADAKLGKNGFERILILVSALSNSDEMGKEAIRLVNNDKDVWVIKQVQEGKEKFVVYKLEVGKDGKLQVDKDGNVGTQVTDPAKAKEVLEGKVKGAVITDRKTLEALHLEGQSVDGVKTDLIYGKGKWRVIVDDAQDGFLDMSGLRKGANAQLKDLTKAERRILLEHHQRAKALVELVKTWFKENPDSVKVDEVVNVWVDSIDPETGKPRESNGSKRFDGKTLKELVGVVVGWRSTSELAERAVAAIESKFGKLRNPKEKEILKRYVDWTMKSLFRLEKEDYYIVTNANGRAMKYRLASRGESERAELMYSNPEDAYIHGLQVGLGAREALKLLLNVTHQETSFSKVIQAIGAKNCWFLSGTLEPIVEALKAAGLKDRDIWNLSESNLYDEKVYKNVHVIVTADPITTAIKIAEKYQGTGKPILLTGPNGLYIDRVAAALTEMGFKVVRAAGEYRDTQADQITGAKKLWKSGPEKEDGQVSTPEQDEAAGKTARKDAVLAAENVTSGHNIFDGFDGVIIDLGMDNSTARLQRIMRLFGKNRAPAGDFYSILNPEAERVFSKKQKAKLNSAYKTEGEQIGLVREIIEQTERASAAYQAIQVKRQVISAKGGETVRQVTSREGLSSEDIAKLGAKVTSQFGGKEGNGKKKASSPAKAETSKAAPVVEESKTPVTPADKPEVPKAEVTTPKVEAPNDLTGTPVGVLISKITSGVQDDQEKARLEAWLKDPNRGLVEFSPGTGSLTGRLTSRGARFESELSRMQGLNLQGLIDYALQSGLGSSGINNDSIDTRITLANEKLTQDNNPVIAVLNSLKQATAQPISPEASEELRTIVTLNAGGNLHNWLYYLGNNASRFGLSDAQGENLLKAADRIEKPEFKARIDGQRFEDATSSGRLSAWLAFPRYYFNSVANKLRFNSAMPRVDRNFMKFVQAPNVQQDKVSKYSEALKFLPLFMPTVTQPELERIQQAPRNLAVWKVNFEKMKINTIAFVSLASPREVNKYLSSFRVGNLFNRVSGGSFGLPKDLRMNAKAVLRDKEALTPGRASEAIKDNSPIAPILFNFGYSSNLDSSLVRLMAIQEDRQSLVPEELRKALLESSGALRNMFSGIFDLGDTTSLQLATGRVTSVVNRDIEGQPISVRTIDTVVDLRDAMVRKAIDVMPAGELDQAISGNSLEKIAADDYKLADWEKQALVASLAENIKRYKDLYSKQKDALQKQLTSVEQAIADMARVEGIELSSIEQKEGDVVIAKLEDPLKPTARLIQNPQPAKDHKDYAIMFRYNSVPGYVQGEQTKNDLLHLADLYLLAKLAMQRLDNPDAALSYAKRPSNNADVLRLISGAPVVVEAKATKEHSDAVANVGKVAADKKTEAETAAAQKARDLEVAKKTAEKLRTVLGIPNPPAAPKAAEPTPAPASPAPKPVVAPASSGDGARSNGVGLLTFVGGAVSAALLAANIPFAAIPFCIALLADLGLAGAFKSGGSGAGIGLGLGTGPNIGKGGQAGNRKVEELLARVFKALGFKVTEKP
ncbi:MAG: hypothetical protein NTZ63_07015, partial [Candidatus Omnitrophica bacterium]|nr:hypothetical protein [Candidatus Omnitrophota bacterium]